MSVGGRSADKLRKDSEQTAMTGGFKIKPTQLALLACCGLCSAVVQTSHAIAQGSGIAAGEVMTVEAALPVPVDSIDVSWEFSGTVQARRRSRLSFERVGKLQSVLVEKGAAVKAGQVIAELNSEVLRAQIKKHQADRRAAEALLSELRAGTRAETLAAARAGLHEQEAMLKNAKSTLIRRELLHKQRLLAAEELEQASAAVQRYEATTDAASQRLAELEAGTRAEKIQSQEAVVAAVIAGIETLEIELEQSRLRSPFDGIVIERLNDEGAIVSPNQPVLTVLETSNLEVHIGVPSGTARQIQLGDPVKIQVRDQTLTGKIHSIVQEVGVESRTQEVIIQLEENAIALVIPGENARLALTRSQLASGFWIPATALLRGPRGLWECYLVTELNGEQLGKIERISVENIKTDGERVLVSGDVPPQARVVVTATHRVTNGQIVRVSQTGTAR